MKIDKTLIRLLRNGDIAVRHNGNDKRLRKVLKKAFKNERIPKSYLSYGDVFGLLGAESVQFMTRIDVEIFNNNGNFKEVTVNLDCFFYDKTIK